MRNLPDNEKRLLYDSLENLIITLVLGISKFLYCSDKRFHPASLWVITTHLFADEPNNCHSLKEAAAILIFVLICDDKTWKHAKELSASPPHHSPSRSTSVIFSFHDVMKNDKYTSFHDEWFHFGFSFHIKSTWQANWKQVRELITNASRSHHVFDILREHLHIVLCSFPPSARRLAIFYDVMKNFVEIKAKPKELVVFFACVAGKANTFFREVKLNFRVKRGKIR